MFAQVDAREITPDRVRTTVRPIFDSWDIKRAWLFGSVARGTQTKGSDVDLSVELLEDARIGFGIVRLQDELEEALGVDVDIHTVPDPKRTNPAFMRNYEASRVLVYERTTE